MNNGQIDIFIVLPNGMCNKNLGTIFVKLRAKNVWYNSLKNINHLGLDAQINNWRCNLFAHKLFRNNYLQRLMALTINDHL